MVVVEWNANYISIHQQSPEDKMANLGDAFRGQYYFEAYANQHITAWQTDSLPNTGVQVFIIY